jgi:hypothetical protein
MSGTAVETTKISLRLNWTIVVMPKTSRRMSKSGMRFGKAWGEGPFQ